MRRGRGRGDDQHGDRDGKHEVGRQHVVTRAAGRERVVGAKQLRAPDEGDRECGCSTDNEGERDVRVGDSEEAAEQQLLKLADVVRLSGHDDHADAKHQGQDDGYGRVACERAATEQGEGDRGDCCGNQDARHEAVTAAEREADVAQGAQEPEPQLPLPRSRDHGDGGAERAPERRPADADEHRRQQHAGKAVDDEVRREADALREVRDLQHPLGADPVDDAADDRAGRDRRRGGDRDGRAGGYPTRQRAASLGP